MATTTENLIAKQTEPQLRQFERFENQPKQPGWVFPLRKAGISRFAELGFPTLKDEDWRFTNVAPIATSPFKPVFEPRTNDLNRDRLARLAFGALPSTRLVFVDGHFAPGLSSASPSGIKAGSLAAALQTQSDFLQRHLGRYAQGEDNAFT